MDTSTFEISCSDVTACSRAGTAIVQMPASLWGYFVLLAGSRSEEWLAYLVGELTPHGTEPARAVIESCYFPPQAVEQARVHSVSEHPDYVIRPRTIGAIHSHVRMRAKFTTTDRASANWPLEVVVNAMGEYEASLRLTLPCGAFFRHDASLQITELAMEDLEHAIVAGTALEAERAQAKAADVPPWLTGLRSPQPARVIAPDSFYDLSDRAQDALDPAPGDDYLTFLRDNMLVEGQGRRARKRQEKAMRRAMK